MVAAVVVAGCEDDTTYTGSDSMADTNNDANNDANNDGPNNDVNNTGNNDQNNGPNNDTNNDVNNDGPNNQPNNEQCVEQCGGGFACIGGQILACDQTAECGQCGCTQPIDADPCDFGCIEGEQAEFAVALCEEVPCGCATDEDCGLDGLVCSDCECVENPVPACEEVCQERVANEPDLCPFDFFHDESCEASCAEIRGRFGPDVVEALDECLVTDPLCFQGLNDCMYQLLYPEGVRADVEASALAGFEAFAGMPVTAGITSEDGLLVTNAMVDPEGQWAVNWLAADRFPIESLSVLYFIDVDGDMTCNAQVDHAGVGRIGRGDDFERPSYSGEIIFDERSLAFVCDEFNF